MSDNDRPTKKLRSESRTTDDETEPTHPTCYFIDSSPSHSSGSDFNSDSSSDSTPSSNGSDSDDSDDNAITIHKAAQIGDIEGINACLARGVPVDSVPDVRAPGDERTPLEIAARYNQPKAILRLLEAGARLEGHYSNYQFTPLHIAAKYGSCDAIETLLRKGSPIDQRTTHFSQTPLHIAAEHGQLGAIEKLIQKRADQNAGDWDQRTPFHLAVIHSQVDAMLLLASKKGVNIKAKAKRDFTAIHFAATETKEKIKTIIGHLLSMGFSIEAKTGSLEENDTPLRLAIRNNRRVTLRALVAEGADIESPDKDQRTAIMRAVTQGNKKVINILLDNGADLRATDKFGLGVLHHVAASDMEGILDELIPFLLNNDALDIDQLAHQGESALYFAAQYYNNDALRELVTQGACVDANRLSSLKMAAEQGDREAMNILLDNGASVSADKLTTPFQWAATHSRIGAMMVLIEEGAPPGAKDWDGNTAMHWAGANAGDNAIKYLIDLGLQVNEVNQRGQTPLHFAAQNGNVAAINTLVAKGANVNVPDRYGFYPLHMAIIHSRIRAVRTLIIKKTNIEATTPSGNTALHQAVLFGATKIVKLLLEKGASTKVYNWEGLTPLHIVAAGNIVRRKPKTFTDIPMPVDDGHEKASEGTFTQIIKLFTAHQQTDLNIPDKQTMSTPLHWAIKSGRLKVVEALVNNGARLDTRDSDGNSPLHIAAQQQDSAIASYLVSKGADVFTTNNDGSTPLAIAKGETSVVEKNIVAILEAKMTVQPATGNARHKPSATKRNGNKK